MRFTFGTLGVLNIYLTSLIASQKIEFLLAYTNILGMKKYSMLVGGLVLISANIYGLVIACLFKPVSIAIVVVALLVIALVSYIEWCKRRVLLDAAEKESYLLFAATIVFQLYFTITAFSLLVYFSEVQLMRTSDDNKLKYMVAGIDELSFNQVETFNLPYYFANFFAFMYYLRCFYVMFWRQNIVFIYRYLKKKVNQLNQTLLAHLPMIDFSQELADTICSLCLEEYKSDEKITRLNCKHVYHLDCIRVWVLRSNCCPLCRKRVVF